MKGRIIEIKEDEKDEYNAIIIVGVLKDILSLKPLHYRKDWRNHQDEYGDYDLEDFRLYDKAFNEHEKLRIESQNFHLGNVELKQK